ncbi:unannotated protein [freshwater metagenome]|uniref:Unannotated protein n=1 Tax=freshwater metagenome TaxID=449393 RepID=A0A6J7DIH8_9ZZZZ
MRHSEPRPSEAPSRLPALLTCTLLTATLVALVPVANAPVASAAPAPGASINVVIDSLAPLIATRSGDLRIAGRIVNIGSRTIEQVSLQATLSDDPLTERSQLGAIAIAPLDGGDAVPRSRAIDTVSHDMPGKLTPGEQESFWFSVPLRDTRLGAAGTYVVSVEASGVDVSISGSPVLLGVQRTFVPWFPKGSGVTPVGLTWLWPLTDWPARDADGVFLDDQTPAALTPGGRLAELVDVASERPSIVSWLVDPEILQAATQIARGYQVRRDGELVVGDHSADAKNWLASLKAALRGNAVHLLPYADIDASAARRSGLERDVVRAVTSAPDVAQAALGRSVGTVVEWAPVGRLDKQTSNLIASSGVDTVILSSTALPPDDEATSGGRTPSGIANFGTVVGNIDAVLVDQGLSAALGARQLTEAEIVLARQRFLAETALIAVEPDAKPNRILAAAPSDIRWHPAPSLVSALLRATEQAPWLRPASLEALRRAERVPRTRVPYGSDGISSELAGTYMAKVVAAQTRVDRLASILDDPATVAPAYLSSILRAQSTGWRSQPATGLALISDINIGITGRIAAVHVLSSGRVIFSGDSGRVPVTIANDGEQSVTIGVGLVGEPAARLESTPLTGITVDPGRKVSVDLSARVVGGEPLTVEVQLLTPSGAPYGVPGEISLVSTAYSRAAAWVMGAAFLAIAAFVVVGIGRRIRGSRRGGPGSPPEALAP